MVEKLHIKNFKSINDLKINCKKINIFIGEPNTGKSNILEALGLLNIYYTYGEIRSYLRMRDMNNLFYEGRISDNIEVNTGVIGINLLFKDEIYYLFTRINQEIFNTDALAEIRYSIEGAQNIVKLDSSINSPFKYYKYNANTVYNNQYTSLLLPPFGSNLYNILSTNDSAYDFINNLVSEYGFDLTLNQQRKEIELYKKVGKGSTLIPYNNLADTFLRISFFVLSIMTNDDSILSFDEPDVFTFPFYTKYLAEKIGRDKSNQFFIVTHNPYFLTSVIEKTTADDILIHLTYFRENQTNVISFTPKELQAITDLDSSIFFNLKNLIPV